MDLGLEVETFREARCGCSSLGGRVRVDQIGRVTGRKRGVLNVRLCAQVHASPQVI